MEALLQDLRYAFRTLRRSPLFSIAVIMILAISIGANTAIFSFVNGVLLTSLPFREPERIVVLGETNPEKAPRIPAVSPRNLEDWQKQSKTLDDFGAWRDWSFRITTQEGRIPVSAGIASPELFTALALNPVAGRLFLADDNQRGHDHVVLISYRYWQSDFGGDPGVVGRSITLNNESFTIIGVLPNSLRTLGLGRFDVWAPVSVDPDQYLERHVRNRRVYARMRQGVSIKEVQAEMNTISEQLATQYPKDNAGYQISITSLQDSQTGDVRPALLVFLAAVGFVLLIACANVANLLLARSTTRRKEFAIRTALGATRSSLIRQLLSEAVVLSSVGGLLGVLLAVWLVDLFVAINPGNIPRISEVKIDFRVVAFALTLSISTGIIFGLAPAFVSSRVNLVQHLKEGQRGSALGLGRRLRALLVIAQVALAMALMVGAGLLGKSFLHLITLRPGFNPEKLLTIQLFLPMEKYKKRDAVADFYDRVGDELRTIPGVQSVGATSAGPQFGGFEPVDYLVEGESPPSSGEYPRARYYNVGPDYFRTMQVPVLAGREFNERDTPSSPQVAVINQTMAHRSFAGEDAIGKRIILIRENQALEIIGVVGDVKRFEADAVVEPEVYYPYKQRVRWASYFAIRTDSDPASILPAVRSRLMSLDSDVLLSNVSTVDKLVGNALRAPRFNAALIGAFAVLALLLASFGLYAVISYSVTQRTHEIGVRMTVGADQHDILKLIVGNGMVLTLIGNALGLVLSLAITRLMMSLLFEVSVTDPLTFGGIALVLTSVALLACYLPARRATRIDPMTALRCE